MQKKIARRREWGRLVEMCLETASTSEENTEKWKSQEAALDLLPFPLGDELMHRLVQRRLLSPSLLRGLNNSVEEIDLSKCNAINDELIETLAEFRYLSTFKLANCHVVNDSSLSHICGLRRVLKELDLSGCDQITDTGVQQLVCIQSLEKLYLSHTRLSEDGVITLSCLSNLNLLDLGGIPVTDTALSSLQVLTKLEHLDVRGSKISNNSVRVFESFPKLGFLNIACTEITFLPLLPSIETLILSHCRINSLFLTGKETNPPLSKLVLSWTKLNISACTVFTSFDPKFATFLDLSGARDLQELSFLEKMNNLEHLDLGYSEMTGTMLHAVAKVGYKLKYLNLRRTRVDSYGVSVLAGSVPNLEYLSLAGTIINDRALYYIGMMTSLKKLDINNTMIFGVVKTILNTTTYSLGYLKTLSKLENLNLADTHMRIKSLQPIAELENLRALYLYNDFENCKTLRFLPLNPNLKHLKLYRPQMRDWILRSFTPNKALSTLDLSGCNRLSESAVKIFCRKHPQIKVIHPLNI